MRDKKPRPETMKNPIKNKKSPDPNVIISQNCEEWGTATGRAKLPGSFFVRGASEGTQLELFCCCATRSLGLCFRIPGVEVTLKFGILGVEKLL